MRDLADLVPLDLLDVLAVCGRPLVVGVLRRTVLPTGGPAVRRRPHPLAAAAVMAGISASVDQGGDRGPGGRAGRRPTSTGSLRLAEGWAGRWPAWAGDVGGSG